jgi:hypothetical protein
MLKHAVKSIHRYRLALTVVIVLAFFRLAGAGPLSLASFLGAEAGRAIGMSTSVPENPFNKLAQSLKDKERALDERERALDERENSLSASGGIDPLMFWTLLSGIFILFMLIAVNFYHDAIRRRERERRAKEDEK